MKRLLVIVLVLAACREQQQQPVPPPPQAPAVQTAAAEAGRPEEVVTELGKRMKRVSLSLYPESAARAIHTEYSGLVDAKLLAAWEADPPHAPGRAVSSPWPERIDIQSVSRSGEEATVAGSVVEMTSTGEAGRTPVQIRLRRNGSSWLIVGYETDGAAAAAQTVRNYYQAISRREYRRAYNYWGPSGPPHQTFEAFVEGFRDTKSVDVITGQPSRVEGAAGSRYVDIPVTVTAKTRAGETQRFSGTYTLRRSVVEGGDPEWHIERASLRPTSSGR